MKLKIMRPKAESWEVDELAGVMFRDHVGRIEFDELVTQNKEVTVADLIAALRRFDPDASVDLHSADYPDDWGITIITHEEAPLSTTLKRRLAKERAAKRAAEITEQQRLDRVRARSAEERTRRLIDEEISRTG